MKKPTKKPSHKRATIETDGKYFYLHTAGVVSRYATQWRACVGAVRAHREWIDKQPGGRYDHGVKITLPDGRWRMGWLQYAGVEFRLDEIKAKRK